MANVLIIGATRGLGAALATQYATRPDTTVYATSRSPTHPAASKNTIWIPNIDLLSPTAGPALAAALPNPLTTVIITAGIFPAETLSTLDFAAEVKTYTISAVAPPFIAASLHKAGLLPAGAKFVLITSEAGSIGLRHQKEGGGNYAHHGSKAAGNMVGKLLALDLEADGVIVGMVHVGLLSMSLFLCRALWLIYLFSRGLCARK
jgi:NAD(P)-dependent dehydrogenase (short-subunit alcohol dehydrogenase family)